MKKKMLMIIFGLGLVFLPAGQVKAEELHSDEHSMEAMHSSIEHGQGHSEEHVMGTEEMESKEAVYTCPMHPEVRETTPGKCPICGMFLERVENSGEEEEPLEDEGVEKIEGQELILAEESHDEEHEQGHHE